MPPNLRLALLGCGEGAQRHHLPILARLDGVELATVADPVSSARIAASRGAPDANVVEDWRQALATPGLDAVVVCLPSAAHADATVAALERGLHVYVEKPLATSLVDADRVVAAWREAGVVGMTGFNYRFNALYRSARQLLASGRLGGLLAARTVFTLVRADVPGWKRARADGGGVLLDLASHHVDLARWLLDDVVVEARASIHSRHSEEDTALVELRLTSGLVVQSLFAYGTVEEERFEIYAEAGRLVVDRRRHQDAVFERAGRGRLGRAGAAIRDLTRVGSILEKRFAAGHEPSHRVALAAFAAAVRTLTPSKPDLEDGRACLAAIEAAERSARSGRAEPVEQVQAASAAHG
jgi:predicted dehydrogenase